MRRIGRLLWLPLIALVAVSFCTGCGSGRDDTIVARVGRTNITYDDLMQKMNANNVVELLRRAADDGGEQLPHQGDVDTLGEPILEPGQALLHGVDHVNDVGASALLHGEGDRGLEVEAGASGLVFESIGDMGHVLDVDGHAILDLDDEVLDLPGFLHLGRDPHQVLEATDVDRSTDSALESGHGESRSQGQA